MKKTVVLMAALMMAFGSMSVYAQEPEKKDVPQQENPSAPEQQPEETPEPATPEETPEQEPATPEQQPDPVKPEESPAEPESTPEQSEEGSCMDGGLGEAVL